MIGWFQSKASLLRQLDFACDEILRLEDRIEELEDRDINFRGLEEIKSVLRTLTFDMMETMRLFSHAEKLKIALEFYARKGTDEGLIAKRALGLLSHINDEDYLEIWNKNKKE